MSSGTREEECAPPLEEVGRKGVNKHLPVGKTVSQILEEWIQSPQAKNHMCKGMEKYHFQGPVNAPSGKNGASVRRLHRKDGLGTAGELFKNQRERSGMRGFAFYEENAGPNLKDLLEREWEGIFEMMRPF